MSKLRVTIEWAFGETARHVAFCDYPKELKLDKGPVASYWLVAALLQNCRSCLYGNEGSQ